MAEDPAPKRPRRGLRAHVVTWNYTTILNIVFLTLAAALVWRFVRTGGLPMRRMMDEPMSERT